MAKTVDPKIMEHVLRTPNWSMATQSAGIVLDRDDVFERVSSPPPPTLVVPVDVQALYVSKSPNPDEKFAIMPMDLSSADKDKSKSPEPFKDTVERPAGIHLHWALPDGLLRGEMTEDDDNPFKLSPLPDRWLVVRMTGRRGVRTMDMKGWVIESEAGQVFDLEGYPITDPKAKTGPEIESAQLDAMAGGSPSWTSSYDAAINRFAFHDDLSGLNANAVHTGVATYVVIGWWNERNSDPVAKAYSPLSISRILDDFCWSASPAPVVWNYSHIGAVAQPQTEKAVGMIPARTESLKNTAIDLRSELRMTASQLPLTKGYRELNFDSVLLNMPRRPLNSVFHGTVYGVPIRGKVTADEAPKASAIDLAFAPTLETMMASFASKGMGLTSIKDREFVESLVTAVANSSIRDISSPDGIVALDEAEHSDGFETFQGPETYVDVIKEGLAKDLRGGRAQRSFRAREKAPDVIKTDLMWHKGTRGKTVYSVDAMRSRVSELVDKKFSFKAESLAATGNVRQVKRPGPRYYRATAPVIGLRNFGRHPRFNGDCLHRDDETLWCRWASELVVGFGDIFDASDYLGRLSNSELPKATNRILQNTFLFDPYKHDWVNHAISVVLPDKKVSSVQNRLRGEMALRFSSDGIYDGTATILRGKKDSSGLDAGSDIMKAQASQHLFDHSLFEGVEPSPVAITSWAQPWSPVWMEWEIEITPGDGLKGFSLDMVDFTGRPNLKATKQKISGRAPITSGLAKTYQSVIHAYLLAESQRDEQEAGEISDEHGHTLATLARFLGHSDLGSITLNGLEEYWLGLEVGPDSQVIEAPKALSQALKDADIPRLLASGQLRLTKARVIDSFGRIKNITVSKTIHPAAHQMGSGSKKSLRHPPRLVVPSRLMWRLSDPSDLSAEATEANLNQDNPELMINPVAGFLLPDFIDEALEFFNAAGDPLGQVMHDSVTGGLAWEGGVGREGAAVTIPTEGLAPKELIGGLIAKGMIDADTAQRANPETANGESPLSAFLRAVDTTSWSVEGNLNLSGASVASLVGRPIAVVTARLHLDIPSDLSLTGAYGDEATFVKKHLLEQAVHDKLKSVGFPVRLGDISKAHDGLYGYFINHDYSKLNLVEASVAGAARVASFGNGFRALYGLTQNSLGADFLPVPSPLDCPYFSAPKALSVHNGQTVRLTLLMHPYARIHATTGILPRKSLELLREWVTPGITRIAPSARIGPVIIDPDKIRLPKIAAYGANQNWVHRDTPLTWREDPILSATQAALLPDGPTSIQEGYIRIAPHKDKSGGA